MPAVKQLFPDEWVDAGLLGRSLYSLSTLWPNERQRRQLQKITETKTNPINNRTNEDGPKPNNRKLKEDEEVNKKKKEEEIKLKDENKMKEEN